MKFTATDGTIVTDELLEQMAEPWDNGEVPGTGGPVHRGRPRLSHESTTVVSFKVPKSQAERFARAAKSLGVTRSSFLRDAASKAADAALA